MNEAYQPPWTMLDPVELARLRFEMSEVPAIGGQPGTYQERLAQWFLERSFFRDFVYRNPRGRKKGQELADAVVLFDDVVLMVQVKAQCGSHTPILWATEKLDDALKQLRTTHDDLVGGSISKLRNDFYGEIAFDIQRFPTRIGLIILAHESAPYVAAELVPNVLAAGFPIHVFSLKDFSLIASRFDTAGDLVTFLELRGDVASRVALHVQDEVANIESMTPHVEEALRAHMGPTTPEVMRKTVGVFEETATGRLAASSDWKFGLAIDDMIARAHDIDAELPWNRGGTRQSAEVAKFLGWLTRYKRIRLGKRIIQQCEDARDQEVHYFSHIQPSRGTASVYLATSQGRADRVKTLQFLVSYAQMKYGANQCFGVATEPIGDGRSYDFVVRNGSLPPALRSHLGSVKDPFSSEEPLQESA